MTTSQRNTGTRAVQPVRSQSAFAACAAVVRTAIVKGEPGGIAAGDDSGHSAGELGANCFGISSCREDCVIDSVGHGLHDATRDQGLIRFMPLCPRLDLPRSGRSRWKTALA